MNNDYFEKFMVYSTLLFGIDGKISERVLKFLPKRLDENGNDVFELIGKNKETDENDSISLFTVGKNRIDFRIVFSDDVQINFAEILEEWVEKYNV